MSSVNLFNSNGDEKSEINNEHLDITIDHSNETAVNGIISIGNSIGLIVDLLSLLLLLFKNHNCTFNSSYKYNSLKLIPRVPYN